MTLDHTYHNLGLSFRYPAGWELTEESNDELTTVSLFTDGAQWSVSLISRRPSPRDVLRQTIAAYRDIYPDLELSEGKSNSRTALATLEFFAMELVNWVSLRSDIAGGRTLLIMLQATDHVRDELEPVLRSISDSLQLDADDEVEIR